MRHVYIYIVCSKSMKQINKIYLTSRLATDNVVEYEDGEHFGVNVRDMTKLVTQDGANRIMIFIKDNDNRLSKRVQSLITNTNTVYEYENTYGFTDELATLEDYATNYFVISIRKINPIPVYQ